MQTISFGVPYSKPGAAIRWLAEIFGVRTLKFWGPADDPVFAYLAWGNTVFSVFVRPTDSPWAAVGPVSMGLLADEETIRASYDRAVNTGAEVIRELQEQSNPAVPEGYLGFTLRDAEGNLWSMESRHPTFDLG